ncbi:MAG: DUF1287 domain-containing protein [Oscillospiraceae bacterium]|nr:DUF1287 domain-containing protein [Oscillospiraceae bacterium]MDD4413833.1 DUF1287 domain-containing protein [Oscillospiraceae bacterium]
MKKKLIITCIIFVVLAAASASLYALFYFNIIPRKIYTAEDFGIETVKSEFDNDDDGLDDYTDILLSAREYIKTKPKYKSAYYEGGYPPQGEGVCTDVIWQALKGAGYSLKDLVDFDILYNTEVYPGVNMKPDSNIDFRRVRNLLVFLNRKAESLTLETDKIAEWQPGDIVVFEGHIAIVSDKRNKKGVPYILHNGGQPVLEEDAMSRYSIVGHFRWNGFAS